MKPAGFVAWNCHCASNTVTSHQFVWDKAVSNNGWLSRDAKVLLLYIQMTETANIHRCDVPLSNVNRNEVCLPHPREHNDHTLVFQSGKLTEVINTSLTLTLLDYFFLFFSSFFTHLYYKLGLGDKDWAHQSTFLLICQKLFDLQSVTLTHYFPLKVIVIFFLTSS